MMRCCLRATFAALLSIGIVGCSHLPGKPGFRPETMRPDQTHDFTILYQQNCSACHGDNGLNGAALPLNNSLYLEWAGHDRIRGIVANGIPHSLMPAFGQGGGGMLTNQQVEDIVNGMMTHWGRPGVLNGAAAPGYAPASIVNIAQGQTAFQTYCARCHGADGKGIAKSKDPSASSGSVTGSIVDPTYLALISRQGLRDIIVSGVPDGNMPDWRGDLAGKPMTDSDVTNIVAWLLSHSGPAPGLPTSLSQAEQERQNQQNLGSSGMNRQP